MIAFAPLRRAAAGLVLGIALLAPPAFAAVTPAALDEAAQRDLARIEAYLNDLTTLDSRFVQLSQDGFVEGRLRLSRPGDLRIDYEAPVPVEIVASGIMMMYHDRELGQTTFLPVSETPAYFLLRDRIDLSDGLTVTAFEREASAIRVTIVETGNPDAGEITVVFEDKPLRLVKWRVTDATGNIIDVALVDPRFGVTFDNASELFSTVDPQFGRTRE
ncbi:MAG: outer membrane lipoprotein carrier protein LolA [Alphaproteobacteria bacterium]